jgi:hypothetical protein
MAAPGARRDREIPSKLEFAEIGLPDLQVAAPAPDVLGEELHSTNEVLAVGGKACHIERCHSERVRLDLE